MADDSLECRFIMACARRANAVANRQRALLNIEIAERNAISAEAKVAEEDAAITVLLDERLMADAGS
jgi:hypothetical protein